MVGCNESHQKGSSFEGNHIKFLALLISPFYFSTITECAFYSHTFETMKQDLLKELEALIKEGETDDAIKIGRLRQLVYEHDYANLPQKESIQFSDLLSEQVAELNEVGQSKNVLSTGFDSMDDLLGGFSPGEFVVFGGRPGMGKTQFLVSLVLKMVQQNPVLYFSFDLSESSLALRFMAAISGIPIGRMHKKALNETEKEVVKNLTQGMHEIPLYINTSLNSSLTLFKAQCQKMVAEKGVKIIVVDYIQLMSTHRSRNNREMEISIISRELKNIARDLNVCVLAASQLSRSVETRGGDKRPYLSDLRESGAIEQDADKVIFLYRSNYYGLMEDENGMPTDGIAELIVAKNRSGILENIRIGIDTDFTCFKDLEESNRTRKFSFKQDRLNSLNDSDDFLTNSKQDIPF
jgi:replicative DNA helicase